MVKLLRSIVAAMAVAAAIAPSAIAAAKPDVRAPRSQLELARENSSFGVKFQRYQQELDGLPVIGADAVAAPGLLRDRTVAGVTSPDAPTVSRSHAIEVAERATGATALRAPSDADLAILPAANGQRTVWRV